MTDWVAGQQGATGQVVTLFEIASPAVGYSLDTAVNDSLGEVDIEYPQSGISAPLANDVVQVDDEDMLISAVQAYGVGLGYTLTVTRAWGGSTAASHAVGASVRLWRDFGNLLPNAATGKHRILSLPTIKHTAEKNLNSITSSISTLRVANGDYQWNDPTWFDTWSGRLVRFYWATPEEDRAGEGVASPKYYMTALGTFVIDEVVCKGDVADIKLVSLDLPLREDRSAEGVRDKGWFQTKPAKWLLERLLGAHYHSAKESPPKYWTADIEDNLELETKGSRSVFSNYGRPPEWDGSSWLSGQDEICRALCLDKDGANLIYGVGDTVYRRDLTTLVDTSLGIPTGATGYKIVRLWRPSQGSPIAYGIALSPKSKSGRKWTDFLGKQTSAEEYVLTQDMIAFKVNADYSLGVFTAQNCYSGFQTVHALTWALDDPAYATHTSDEFLAVPFPQRVAGTGDDYDVNGRHTPVYTRISTGPENTDYVASSINATVASGMTNWWTDSTKYKTLDELDCYVSPAYRGKWFQVASGFPYQHYSMGQRGCFAYNKYFSTAGAIYFMRPNFTTWDALHTLITFRVCRIDCATGTVKECIDDSIIVYHHLSNRNPSITADCPTAMCTRWTGSAVQVFVATHKTISDVRSAYVASDNRIKRYLDTAVGSNPTYDAAIFDNDAAPEGNAWRYYTILEMSVGPNAQIYMLGLVRGGATLYILDNKYRAARISADAAAGTNPTMVPGPYGSNALASQLCGMFYDDTVTDENYRLWAVDGSGLLVRYSLSGDSWEVEPGISSMVMEEPSCTGALATNIQNTTPPTIEIYGVSAPFPSTLCDRTDDSDITYTFPEGKYYLWKVSRHIADRFPLADFSDWSIWDAVQNIAAAVQRVAWFDRRGKFRFEPLPDVNGSGADHDISAVDAKSGYLYIPWLTRPNLAHGGKEVYNSATAIPYDTVISQPSNPRLALSPGSELAKPDVDNNTYPPSIEISCKSIYPVRVLLRCVVGGRLLATGTALRPSFRLDMDAPQTSLILTQRAASTEYLYVDHIPLNEYGAFEGGDDGDYVTVGSTDYWDAPSGDDGRRIVGWDISGGWIRVTPAINSTNDPDVSGVYPAGTAVNIISKETAAAGTQYTFASGVPVYVGQGITVKMTAGVGSLADEPWFHVGDTLVIETNGLKLEKAERSIQSVVSVASIKAGFGKREAKMEDNRLLTKATALELARYRVDSYKYPHFELTGGAWRFIPWLDPLTVLHVRDSFLFPNSAVAGLPAKTERVYVRSVSQNLRGLRTEVELRGTRDIT